MHYFYYLKKTLRDSRSCALPYVPENHDFLSSLQISFDACSGVSKNQTTHTQKTFASVKVKLLTRTTNRALEQVAQTRIWILQAQQNDTLLKYIYKKIKWYRQQTTEDNWFLKATTPCSQSSTYPFNKKCLHLQGLHHPI